MLGGVWLESLAAIAHLPDGQVGGKAAALARLAQAGLAVPPAWVVPVSVFEEALREGGAMALAEGLGTGEASWKELEQRVLGLPIGPALRGLQSNSSNFAVRSSAVGEDGADRSFAGQHASVVGVPREGLADAVRTVWASLYGPSSHAYRQGVAPAPGAMAVLVQPLIAARCAGVAFSVDPVSGAPEVVVEAVHGLAEPLADGHVTPQRVRFRRGGAGLVPSEDTPHEQGVFKAAWAEGVRPLPDAWRRVQPLDEVRSKEVADLTLEVERIMGEPVDVEWAIDEAGTLWLLQARPLTTRPAPVGGVWWTRRFFGERWPQGCSVLGWSIIGPLLEHHTFYPGVHARHLGGEPLFRLVSGHPYVNGALLERLAFRLPGIGTPTFFEEMMPAAKAPGRLRLPSVRVVAELLGTSLRERRWQRFSLDPVGNPSEWRGFRRRALAHLAERTPEPSDPVDLQERLDALRDLAQTYVGIHVSSLLWANLSWHGLKAVLERWRPQDVGSWMQRLAVCPPGNVSVQAHQAIWELAQALSAEDQRALVQGRALSGPGRRRVDGFLERFGHRGQSTWEVWGPRWRDQPQMVGALVAAQTGSASPALRSERQQARYQRAVEDLRRTAPGRVSGPALGWLYLLRRYLLLRENQREVLEQLLVAMSDDLRWAAERLVEAGALRLVDEVRWLTVDEVLAGLRGDDVPGPDEIRSRRLDATGPPPPVFLRGAQAEATPVGEELRGLPMSGGRHRGRVVHVRTPLDAGRLKPGDVLVTSALDPGWTPLLARAGAVLVELGAVLSHGAVVARELGVPMVGNLSGLQGLRDGEEVEVDGELGVVRRV